MRWQTSLLKPRTAEAPPPITTRTAVLLLVSLEAVPKPTHGSIGPLSGRRGILGGRSSPPSTDLPWWLDRIYRHLCGPVLPLVPDQAGGPAVQGRPVRHQGQGCVGHTILYRVLGHDLLHGHQGRPRLVRERPPSARLLAHRPGRVRQVSIPYGPPLPRPSV